MDLLNTNTPPLAPTCLSDAGYHQPGRRAAITEPAPVPPTPYDPITTIIKRQTRYEQVSDFDHGTQVFDLNGSLWDVREARATQHGFPLLAGHLVGQSLSRRRPKFIVTAELVAYWDRHRGDPNATYNLPASYSCLRSMYCALYPYDVPDRRAACLARKRDLQRLPLHEAAERYNMTVRQAQYWRMKFLGRRARPTDWWQQPAVLETLRSNASAREVAWKFKISKGYAQRLRVRARARTL